LLILENQIFTYQKYTEKVKLKRRTKLIFLNFSCKKWKILYNFKIKCHRPLFLYCRCTQSCLPIAVVEIDSCCIVNMIHATHFWMITLPTLDSYIECRNGSDFRMGASTLVQIQQPLQDSIAIWSQMWIQQGKWMACVISPSFVALTLRAPTPEPTFLPAYQSQPFLPHIQWFFKAMRQRSLPHNALLPMLSEHIFPKTGTSPLH
jgi:hypothetical protein